MDLRNMPRDMEALKKRTGRSYRPYKYYLNWSPTDTELEMQVTRANASREVQAPWTSRGTLTHPCVHCCSQRIADQDERGTVATPYSRSNLTQEEFDQIAIIAAADP